jgi:hypothetical protein
MKYVKGADVNASPVLIACSPANPSFHADSSYWYLSKGIVGINNVCLIQKPLLNERHQQEQQEF